MDDDARVPSSETPGLDRGLQLSMLKQLEVEFPAVTDVQSWPPDPASVTRNLAYLHEHGLVEVEMAEWMNGPPAAVTAKITARGLDFLATDGGLTAVLGVVTVRIEAESIRALIAARLDQADVPPEQKSKLKKHLDTMSAEALKTVTTRLVEEALAYSPSAIRLLHTWLGFAG